MELPPDSRYESVALEVVWLAVWLSLRSVGDGWVAAVCVRQGFHPEHCLVGVLQCFSGGGDRGGRAAPFGVQAVFGHDDSTVSGEVFEPPQCGAYLLADAVRINRVRVIVRFFEDAHAASDAEGVAKGGFVSPGQFISPRQQEIHGNTNEGVVGDPVRVGVLSFVELTCAHGKTG